MALQNAFENLAVEAKQDAIITALGNLLTELQQKYEGADVGLDAATLAALAPLASVSVDNFPAEQPVSGTVNVDNFPADPATETTLADLAAGFHHKRHPASEQTTPLAASAVFTGGWVDIDQAHAFYVIYAANVTFTATVEWSNDGATVASSATLPILQDTGGDAPTNLFFALGIYNSISFPYYRLKVTNSATAQTTVIAQAGQSPHPIGAHIGMLRSPVNDNTVVQHVRAVLMGRTNQGTYANVRVNPSGQLAAEVSSHTTGLPTTTAFTSGYVDAVSGNVQTTKGTAGRVHVQDQHTDLGTETSLLDIKRGLSDYEERYEFDAEGLPLYVGKALDGTLTTAASWTVSRFTFAGGLPTRKQVRENVAWDDRAAVTW